MIGVSAIIFVFVPESPWWLASKDNPDKAAKVLEKFYGDTEGYDVPEQIVRLPLKFVMLPVYADSTIECHDRHYC
jgi:hypothetical protein